jgi:acyl-CoA oxidase
MNDRAALLDDPQLRPFLPLLYVAWADGDLLDADRAAVAARLAQQPWLRPAARAALAGWLDPALPPSATELAAVKNTLELAVGSLPPDARRSLAEIAVGLSDHETGDAATAGAAAEIAALLGIDSLDPSAQGVAPVVADPMPSVEIDVEAMRAARDGAFFEVRAQVRAFLDDPAKRAYGLSPDAHRALVRGWLAELAGAGVGRLAFPTVTTDAPDLRPFMVAFETLAHGDLSLLVKAGVQFGLFGGSVYVLGTERHRPLLADIASLALPGCFAMSEIGHGSNVSDLETVARYDHATREIVVSTPSESARKEWIGGAAHDARIATVFAQLEVGGERHGVHAVLVPLRGDDGQPLPGVRTGDSGHKMGLNGVDNGRLWFDQVRVPVTNLLDRFASIDAEGRYQSPIASPGRRFFTMLGTLVGGRVCVGSAGVSVAETALAIAVRYATTRRQFGPAEGREVPLLVYPTHRRRLIPALATGYVLHFAFEQLRGRFAAIQGQVDADTRELEAEAAGLRRSPAGTPSAPCSNAARRAGPRATCRSTACPISRPTATCSRPSRATTPSSSSWWPRACSPASRSGWRTAAWARCCAWWATWRWRRCATRTRWRSATTRASTCAIAISTSRPSPTAATPWCAPSPSACASASPPPATPTARCSRSRST